MRVDLQLARQQPAAQCAVSQGGEARFPAIGQELFLDLALEQIVRRLYDVQFGDSAKARDLQNREITDADSPDFPLVEKRLHRFCRLFDRDQRIGPVHLIDVDVVGAQPPQRVRRLAQDAVAAGIPEDLPILPLEPALVAMTTCERSLRSSMARPTISSEWPNP